MDEENFIEIKPIDDRGDGLYQLEPNATEVKIKVQGSEVRFLQRCDSQSSDTDINEPCQEEKPFKKKTYSDMELEPAEIGLLYPMVAQIEGRGLELPNWQRYENFAGDAERNDTSIVEKTLMKENYSDVKLEPAEVGVLDSMEAQIEDGASEIPNWQIYDIHTSDLDIKKSIYEENSLTTDSWSLIGLKIESSQEEQILTNDKELLHQCQECGRSFWKQADLEQHMLIHIEEQPFPCNICMRGFDTGKDLEHHMKTTHEKITYCDLCQKRFTCIKQMKSHKTFSCVKNSRRHICNICGKGFHEESHLAIHVKAHSVVRPYSCNYCLESFTRQSALKLHMKKHGGEKPETCGICQKEFYGVCELAKHVKMDCEKRPPKEEIHHEKPNLNDCNTEILGKVPNKCQECGKAFRQLYKLNIHMLIHTGEKPFSCYICDMRFRYKGHLKTHVKHHTTYDRKKFNICARCEMVFDTECDLKLHRQTIHITAKPFTCNLCQKSFHCIRLLRSHESSHSNSIHHICNICGKRFLQACLLANHVKKHGTERPYSCNVCLESFSQQSFLNVHMKKHCGGKPETYSEVKLQSAEVGVLDQVGTQTEGREFRNS